MNHPFPWRLAVALAVTMSGALAEAAENGNPVPKLPSRAEIREQLKGLEPSAREARIRELRERFDSPGPEGNGGRDRIVRMGPEARERMERLQRELRDLPPAEREARMAELRRQFGGRGRPEGAKGPAAVDLSKLTPEQREEFLKLRRRLQELPEAQRAAKLREFFAGIGVELRTMEGAAPDRARQFREMRERALARREMLEKKQADGTITEEEARQLERIKSFRRGPEGGTPGERRRRD